MTAAETVIAQTTKWITDVVVGCNFCPFAARELQLGTIHYALSQHGNIQAALQAVQREVERMNTDTSIETTLLIFPDTFGQFKVYLDLVYSTERLLQQQGYEGVYQVATFHPQYRFARSAETDAANYTNRSPYPMLHLLRESSVAKALRFYSSPERIPERNIRFARDKGLAYMKMLRSQSLGN